MNAIVTWFTAHLAGALSGETIVFIISLFPILELRGGLLASSPAFLNVPILKAVPLCIAGNLLPIPFVLLLFERILRLMKGWKPTREFALWLERHALNRRGQIEKYEFWGLALFVGIPLPGTGAWTGSMIASLLHMEPKKAFLAILVGVVIATVIMSAISYGLLGALAG
ncbi:COG2426 family protein [Clostridium vitabionis]|uniref:COG2426 family protein n=1 Tax=Clostridium vitabionis TaxID=2784388 RepID=UPI00188CB959|nr:small multi-drug export protein [Clostridium vitabionis]